MSSSCDISVRSLEVTLGIDHGGLPGVALRTGARRGGVEVGKGRQREKTEGGRREGQRERENGRGKKRDRDRERYEERDRSREKNLGRG